MLLYFALSYIIAAVLGSCRRNWTIVTAVHHWYQTLSSVKSTFNRKCWNFIKSIDPWPELVCKSLTVLIYGFESRDEAWLVLTISSLTFQVSRKWVAGVWTPRSAGGIQSTAGKDKSSPSFTLPTDGEGVEIIFLIHLLYYLLPICLECVHKMRFATKF